MQEVVPLVTLHECVTSVLAFIPDLFSFQISVDYMSAASQARAEERVKMFAKIDSFWQIFINLVLRQ